MLCQASAERDHATAVAALEKDLQDAIAARQHSTTTMGHATQEAAVLSADKEMLSNKVCWVVGAVQRVRNVHSSCCSVRQAGGASHQLEEREGVAPAHDAVATGFRAGTASYRAGNAVCGVAGFPREGGRDLTGGAVAWRGVPGQACAG